MNYIKLGFVIQGNVQLMLYLPSHGEGKGGGTKYMCMGEISCRIGCRPLRRERERERGALGRWGERDLFLCQNDNGSIASKFVCSRGHVLMMAL